MLKDECILVDDSDRVIGHASKAAAHRFEAGSQPEGLLHRAFSVFLFDDEGASELCSGPRDMRRKMSGLRVTPSC